MGRTIATVHWPENSVPELERSCIQHGGRLQEMTRVWLAADVTVGTCISVLYKAIEFLYRATFMNSSSAEVKDDNDWS